MTAPPGVAVLDVDPFSDEFLAEPYPFHERIREAGAVVWLDRYAIYASARHAEVAAALTNWQVFSSAAGVGIDDFRRSKPWRPPSLILEADPPLHTRTRTVLNRALSAKAMAGLRERFRDAAERLADDVVRRPVASTRSPTSPRPIRSASFPRRWASGRKASRTCCPTARWCSTASGLATRISRRRWRGRARLSAGSTRSARARPSRRTASGRRSGRASIPARSPRRKRRCWCVPCCPRGSTPPSSASETGSSPWPPTRSNGRPCENPARARGAFDEMLRWESPVQTFFRTTTAPIDLGGIALPQDSQNFAISRRGEPGSATMAGPESISTSPGRAGEHVAFGAGIHKCVGQMLARLESEMLLAALLPRVSKIEITGEPVRKLNNSLRQFARLPVELTPA